jgi:hypothetical protein
MLDRIKKLATAQVNKVVCFVEEKAEVPLTEQELGIQALSGAFVVLANADLVIEDQEIDLIANYLVDLPIVAELGIIREVATAFMLQVARVEDAKKVSNVESSIVLGEILAEITLIKEDKRWATVVADTITLVTSGGGADAGEIKARERVLKALGK